MNQMNNPWDDRYSRSEFFYGSEPNDFLVEQSGTIPVGGSVLCLAEGEGRNAVYLAQQGLKVTGVDGSAVGLAKAQQLAAERGVQIQTVVSDLADYDMGVACWDAIVSIWCHLPQPLRTTVHQRVVQALRPGGVFILEAYNPDQLTYKTGGPPTVELLMTVSDLRHELAGLEFQIAQEVVRDVHEGAGHDGPSAVTQILGVKPA